MSTLNSPEFASVATTRISARRKQSRAYRTHVLTYTYIYIICIIRQNDKTSIEMPIFVD